MKIVIQLWDDDRFLRELIFPQSNIADAEVYFQGLKLILSEARASGIDDPYEALFEGACSIPLPPRYMVKKMFTGGVRSHVETPS